ESGDDRVIVGKAAIAVDLHEVVQMPTDERVEAGTGGMARDEHALPWGQRRVDLRTGRLDASLERDHLPVPRVRGRLQRERLELFQQLGDRFFEIQGFWRHTAIQRSDTAPSPTICSSSATSAGDGLTRICDETSAVTRRLPLPPSRSAEGGTSISNDTR